MTTRSVYLNFQIDDRTSEKQFLNYLRKQMPATLVTPVTRQIVGGGYHRPVCAKCKCEMRPERNGTGVLDMADFGPYAVWDADLWKCPECGIEVVGGFAQGPISQHWQPDFGQMVEHYRKAGQLIENKG